MNDELLTIRRYLHAHPELSFEEEKTAVYISQLLTSWGIEHQTNVAGNGITGLIRGRNPEKITLALRADMDALPLQEENNVPYRSLNQNIMHACGHDVHTTCLLGTVRLLHAYRSGFEGSVKFLFQPAEEKLPGGALKMIEAGVLENPRPDYIFGQHVFPELETGKAGFRKGSYMASSDEINLIISGKGGHAALTGTYDNTVLAAAELVTELQKHLSKDNSSVLAFGKFIANGAYNVIPSEVTVQGTLRTFDEGRRIDIHHFIQKTAQSVSARHHTLCRVLINKGYPVLVNHRKATEIARQAAIEYLGKENVVELTRRMTAEDFARYGQVVPACFYRLGTANRKKGITAGLHTSHFDVDENSIAVGTGLLLWITLKTLRLAKKNMNKKPIKEK